MLEERERMKWEITESLKTYVKQILEEVKRRGDEALIEFTEKFDEVKLSRERLRITKEEIEEAYSLVNEKQISKIKSLKERVEKVEKTILESLKITLKIDGIEITYSPKPIQSVGCYVPGGKASYPTTLVMTTTPAKVAGVPRIVVCSPPSPSGKLNPLTLVAADICGVKEIYRVGGAQAIAALAYGTETIKPVKKVVGPGSRYVAVAKLLVSQDVAIDMPGGPSEVLILADGGADARLVALDMISQAEHGADSISGLVTNSERLAEDVSRELGNLIPSLPRGEIVAESISGKGFIVVLDSMDEIVEFVNRFAPEHLEVLIENPEEVLEKITSAGLVLIGSYTPVSLTDYSIGVNHVLPTGGFSHVFSSLSVLDFVKQIGFVECSREALARLAEDVKVLAEAEGLPNHYLAIERRFKD